MTVRYQHENCGRDVEMMLNKIEIFNDVIIPCFTNKVQFAIIEHESCIGNFKLYTI